MELDLKKVSLDAYDTGGELTLTIDARYNYEAYQALNGRAGTVAVYNYKTGEVLCMVSAPSYDPLSVPEDIKKGVEYFQKCRNYAPAQEALLNFKKTLFGKWVRR